MKTYSAPVGAKFGGEGGRGSGGTGGTDKGGNKGR